MKINNWSLRRQRYVRANLFAFLCLNLLPTSLHRGTNRYVPNCVFLRHSELMHEILQHIYKGFQLGDFGRKQCNEISRQVQKQKGRKCDICLPTSPWAVLYSYFFLQTEQWKCDLRFFHCLPFLHSRGTHSVYL